MTSPGLKTSQWLCSTQSKQEPSGLTGALTIAPFLLLPFLSYPNLPTISLSLKLYPGFWGLVILRNLALLNLFSFTHTVLCLSLKFSTPIPSPPSELVSISSSTNPTPTPQSGFRACPSAHHQHFIHNRQVIVRNSCERLSILPNFQLLNSGVFLTYDKPWVKIKTLIFVKQVNEDNTLKGNTLEQIMVQYNNNISDDSGYSNHHF